MPECRGNEDAKADSRAEDNAINDNEDANEEDANAQKVCPQGPLRGPFGPLGGPYPHRPESHENRLTRWVRTHGGKPP